MGARIYPEVARSERAERPSTTAQAADRILGRALPAFFFGLVLFSKADSLIQSLQGAAGNQAQLAFWLTVAQQILTISFFAFVVALFIARRPVAGARSSRLGGAVALAGSFIMNVPVGARVIDDNVVLLLASNVLILAGLTWSVVSLLSLGRCFGVFPEARGLVTRGPYRWVRHPLYLGELTSAFGLVVGTASLALLAVFILLVCLQYWRTRLEERALSEVFPEYAEYRRRTWGLVPGLR